MKKLLALLLLAALAFGAWYAASPWWAMKSLADAAQAQDAEALEAAVDFPALRDSARGEIARGVRAQAGNGGVVDVLGGVLAERIGGEVVDRVLTPEGVGLLVRTGAIAVPLLPERLRGQELSWDVEREGLDSFRGVSTFEDGTSGPILLFERRGIGWQMVGISLDDYG